jgi:ABC-2 family transporter protein
MIWLTWRQFRGQATTAAAALGVLAILLAATAPHVFGQYDSAGLASCHLNCGSAASNFENNIGGLYTILFEVCIGIMYVAPVLMGIFWGAPLVAREYEAGTQRLAWNQSVTRSQWAAAKLGLVGLAAVTTAGLLSLMVSWWGTPIDNAMNQNPVGLTRLSPLVFATRGVAPLGYAAFAFALGVTAGVLVRRTLPAMAITLVIFATIQVLVPYFARPHLIPPAHVTAPFNASSANEIMIRQVQGSSNTMTVVGNFSQPGAWILSNTTITPSGRVFTGPATAACTGNSTQQQCNNWLDSLHLRQLITYQPANRFWPLQWIEACIYLILAAGLGWLCTWQVGRRRA